jgi:hypothetical protein
LLLHEVGEDAGVRCEASEGEAQVLVDGDDFLLVGGELFCIALEKGAVLVKGGLSWGGRRKKARGREVPLKQQVQRVSCSLFLQPHYPA